MTTPHKATPDALCLLELRDRINALDDTLTAVRVELIKLTNATAEIAPNKSAFHAAITADEDDAGQLPTAPRGAA